MAGEFRVDDSRDTFIQEKHFTGVYLKQGAVVLAADLTEQINLQKHHNRLFARAIFGVHGGTEDEAFKIEAVDDSDGKPTFKIGKGCYFVDGLLCVNDTEIDPPDTPVLYREINGVDGRQQPDYPNPPELTKFENGQYLVYLEAWERHISAIEDKSQEWPGIQDVALNGVTTAERSKGVWQVKVSNEPIDFLHSFLEAIRSEELTRNKWRSEILPTQFKVVPKPGSGRLKAQAQHDASESDDACLIPTKSRYRGQENWLYRVEIFTDGTPPTFVWSRHNSSVTFPINPETYSSGSASVTFTLQHLGPDDRLTLAQNNWVEIVTDAYVLNHQPRKLFKVIHIDPVEKKVTLETTSGNDDTSHFDLTNYTNFSADQHPFLRRWDSEGALPVKKPDGEGYIPLEQGIEIFFENANGANGPYQVGDYWLIPARVQTGDIEWPREKQGGNFVPRGMPPHGIDHVYAPLGIIQVDEDGKVTVPDKSDCRRILEMPFKLSST